MFGTADPSHPTVIPSIYLETPLKSIEEIFISGKEHH